MEDTLTIELNTPAIRFVERGGRTVAQTLSRNNPWAGEWECRGRVVLPAEGGGG